MEEFPNQHQANEENLVDIGLVESKKDEIPILHNEQDAISKVENLEQPNTGNQILAWNCQGCGSKNTRNYLRNLIRSNDPDIIFLLETKMSEQKGSSFFRTLSLPKIWSFPSSGLAGGIALLWKEDNCGLFYIGYVGNPYTWCNNRKGLARTKVRLDRVLANSYWLLQNPDAKLKHLTHLGSDHLPILLSLEDFSGKKKRPFKFFRCWLKEDSCKDIISQSWSTNDTGSPAFLLNRKLQNVRS
ncbi:Endonuclease/exonuclease/phosphatase [Macleaya cordata]|uniref:Endonuclease/exonuclease/phosphatase n=1 Tax=Macleaya cordata TaxID=56857 RepID=A0A200Q2C0_MACCD|nr:Endonuclease/exonuclease/phosphatase [Macleaya cordata]